MGCRYLLRFKEGSISSVYGEYQVLRKLSPSRQEEIYLEPGKGGKEKKVWHNYVAGIAYEGHHLKFIENGEKVEEKKRFYFLTDLPVTKRTVKELAESGRKRWKIEN